MYIMIFGKKGKKMGIFGNKSVKSGLFGMKTGGKNAYNMATKLGAPEIIVAQQGLRQMKRLEKHLR
tara:strand:+ start:661 stop:858 length:198 start_codon:yes stop_codon:yes gene_type:complete